MKGVLRPMIRNNSTLEGEYEGFIQRLQIQQMRWYIIQYSKNKIKIESPFSTDHCRFSLCMDSESLLPRKF
jgi:hypothetical protein